jgi:hypothetical protein
MGKIINMEIETAIYKRFRDEVIDKVYWSMEDQVWNKSMDNITNIVRGQPRDGAMDLVNTQIEKELSNGKY